MISSLVTMTYEYRLKELHLFSLFQRRGKGKHENLQNCKMCLKKEQNGLLSISRRHKVRHPEKLFSSSRAVLSS